MVIRMTNAVAVIIQAVSPLFGVGAGAAAAAGAAAGAAVAAAAGAAGAAASAAGAAAAGAAAAGAAGLSSAMPGVARTVAAQRASKLKTRLMISSLERLCTGLTGTDANDLFQLEHEDLAVADLAGVGRLLDGLDHLLEKIFL